MLGFFLPSAAFGNICIYLVDIFADFFRGLGFRDQSLDLLMLFVVRGGDAMKSNLILPRPRDDGGEERACMPGGVGLCLGDG